MRLIILGLVFLVSGCHAYLTTEGNLSFGGAGDASWGRDTFVGHTLEYAESCIGAPSSIIDLPDGGKLLEWSTSEPSIPVSVPLPLVGNIISLSTIAVPMAAFTGALSAQVGGGNGRLMLIVDKQHIIREFHTAGPSDGFTGEDSLIGTDLLRGCRRDAERQRQL